jgi:hypothetical protein
MGMFEPDAEGQPQMFRTLGRSGESVGYWEGE